MNFKKNKIVKSLSRLKKNLLDIFEYIFYRNPDSTLNQKTLYINLSELSQFARYFYLLVKFFHIEGYSIVLPKKYKQFSQVKNENRFIKLLLKERIINFTRSNQIKYSIEFNDYNLSPDYFAFLINKRMDNLDSYHIPMTLFPLMYQKETWNKHLIDTKRKKSIFMIGNFDINQYQKIKKTPFEVLSRIDLYELLEQKKELSYIKSLGALNAFIESVDDCKCILIRNTDFIVHMEDIRPLLSKFTFFLACPGIVMPHSHNLVEAMSTGTIPIIQKSYAEMLHPPLKNLVNCIWFYDENDLTNAISTAYNLSTFQTIEISKNVLNYYNDFLTPKSVIDNIEKRTDGIFYLLAEHRSVEIHTNNLTK